MCFGHHTSGTSVDGVKLASNFSEPLSQRGDMVLQLENPFDTSEIDALLLRKTLHLAHLGDVAA